MKNGLNIGLRQTQKLIMTQTLRQSIEMLQMTNLELSELISNEFLENPILEEMIYSQNEDYLEKNLNKNLNGEENSPIDPDGYGYSDNIGSGGSFNDEDRKNLFIENAVAERESLKDHLLWQANMTAESSDELAVYEEIITVLDDDGILNRNFFESIVSRQKSEVLNNIQHFDPVGCGAFSIQDSLYIQARYFYPDDEKLHEIVRNHFSEIEKLDYGKISRILNISESEIIEKSRHIHGLNPFPGRSYSGREARAVIPDVEVKLIDDELIVTLNDEWVPGIRLSKYYINLLKSRNIDREQREFLSSRLQSAQALMKNISTRRDTILRVTTAIMNRQMEFLIKGPGNLKYLTHHDISEEVGVHESTVSRVSSGKYVQTPWGVFEMKYFFVSRIKNPGLNNSDDQSSDVVKGMIQEIIGGENPENPLSDEEVTSVLKERGVTVARRTIAKYRDMLNIPASTKRKKINLIKS